MPKVSVIVPIYNVEKYIERCLRSLFEQTLDDIEYIFVNDCTLDNSMIILEKVLEEYPHRIKQVKIINHEQNQGQAGARTSGMKAMTGEYMIHCDPDDWVELDMYESMYQKAIEDNSDIVVSDFFHEYGESSIIETHYPENNPQKCIQNYNIPIWWSLCNRLIKINLISKYTINFVKGVNLWEDACLVIRIYYYAQKVSYINKPLYHYWRNNEQSILNQGYTIDKINQAIRCVDYLKNFFDDKQFDITMLYDNCCLHLRNSLLAITPPQYKKWNKLYRHTLKYVIKNENIPVLYRCCYFLAHYHFNFPLKCYYFLSKLNVRYA